MFRPITLWPSPAKKMKEIANRVDKMLVIELNMGQYSTEVERDTCRKCYTIFKSNGRPISPGEIIEKVRGM
jgi:2-oxoglutarate ferredoxin oxidoreductase subunit alpha